MSVDSSQFLMDAFLNRCKRGNSFKEQKNYQRAINEYASSMEALYCLIKITTNSVHSMTIKMQLIIFMGELLQNITYCYFKTGANNKANIFYKAFKEVLTVIESNQSYLDPESLLLYIGLSQMARSAEFISLLTPGDSIVEKDTSVEEQAFEKICSEIDKIISITNFPLFGKISILVSKSNTSNNCFIATVAYSTNNHPDIDTFRKFRDRQLMTNRIGRLLIQLYYKFSPKVANYIKTQPLIKAFIRHQLEKLAEWIRNRE